MNYEKSNGTVKTASDFQNTLYLKEKSLWTVDLTLAMAVTAAGLSSSFSCSGSAAAITTTAAPTTAQIHATAAAITFANIINICWIIRIRLPYGLTENYCHGKVPRRTLYGVALNFILSPSFCFPIYQRLMYAHTFYEASAKPFFQFLIRMNGKYQVSWLPLSGSALYSRTSHSGA